MGCVLATGGDDIACFFLVRGDGDGRWECGGDGLECVGESDGGGEVDERADG